jgi:hypothetical protein
MHVTGEVDARVPDTKAPAKALVIPPPIDAAIASGCRGLAMHSSRATGSSATRRSWSLLHAREVLASSAG